jgi:hypothetical protein
MGIFYRLPLPGGGFEIIGRQGFKALKQATEALLRYQPDMRGRLTEEEIVDVLRKILAREIFVRQRAIGDANATDKLLKLSIRHIRRYHLRTVKHILPFMAPNVRNHTVVKLGPVELIPVNVFFQRHHESIEGERTQVKTVGLRVSDCARQDDFLTNCLMQPTDGHERRFAMPLFDGQMTSEAFYRHIRGLRL